MRTLAPPAVNASLSRRSRRIVSAPRAAAEPVGAAPPSGPSRRTLLLLAAGVAVVGFPAAKTLLKDLGRGWDDAENAPAPLPPAVPPLRTANFAGGCFWCVESAFEALPGVVAVTSGYTGGRTQRPTYLEVCSETTGHKEAVQVLYDPRVTTYEALLDVYWRAVAPTDDGGQFVDRGDSYKPAVWYADDAQRKAAEESKAALQASGVFGTAPVVVPILQASTFWPAERYHQDYFKTHQERYNVYRRLSGRDAFFEQRWGSEYVKVQHDRVEGLQKAWREEQAQKKAAAAAAKAAAATTK